MQMKIVKHRVNSIEELNSLPTSMGVEIDLRTYNGKIILNHDPYKDGISFIDWIKNYRHALLVLNVKEDGLEPKIIKCLTDYKIDEYFFLDQNLPTIVKYALNDFDKMSLRFSEFESIESLDLLKHKCRWVWIDSFFRFSHKKESLKKIKSLGFKLCVVSPELQGRFDPIERAELLEMCNKIGIDAFCTKDTNVC